MIEVPLGEALELIIDHRGKTPKKLGGDFTASGVPVVSAIHIKDGIIQWSERERYVSPQMFAKWMPQRLQKGDVLLTSEAPLGQTALVPSDDDLVLSQRLFALRGKKSVLDSAYLRYFLASEVGQRRLHDRATGTTVVGIRQSELMKVLIPLPSLDEQRRIAGVLGALDDLIEVNRKLMADLDELGLALFRNAWDGQTWCSVSDLGTVTMGQSPPGSTYNEEGRGLVFYQGVRDFGARYPTPRVHCTAATRKADPGDILIAVRAPIGDTNVAVEPTAIGRGLAALKATQPALALRALRATSRTWSAHEGTGTVFSSISGPDLRAAKVPAVTDAALEAHLATLDHAHLGMAQEVTELEETRDELLPLLMSGRVRVGDVAA